MGPAAPPFRKAASPAAAPFRAAVRHRHPKRSTTIRQPGPADPDRAGIAPTSTIPATRRPWPETAHWAGPVAAAAIRAGTVTASRHPGPATAHPRGQAAADIARAGTVSASRSPWPGNCAFGRPGCRSRHPRRHRHRESSPRPGKPPTREARPPRAATPAWQARDAADTTGASIAPVTGDVTDGDAQAAAHELQPGNCGLRGMCLGGVRLRQIQPPEVWRGPSRSSRQAHQHGLRRMYPQRAGPVHNPQTPQHPRPPGGGGGELADRAVIPARRRRRVWLDRRRRRPRSPAPGAPPAPAAAGWNLLECPGSPWGGGCGDTRCRPMPRGPRGSSCCGWGR